MKKSAGVMEGKEDVNKNKNSGERNNRKTKKDEESSFKKTLPKKQKQKPTQEERKMQNDQAKVKEGSVSKLPMKEGKDADNLAIKSLDKNKEKTHKEVTQNERVQEHDEGKKQKEQDDSFEEEVPQNQPQQQDNINGESELNVITSKDSLPKNTDKTPEDNNIDGSSQLPISVEKDANYYRLKQGIPRSTKFCSIASTYMRTERLSPVEAEYNWSRPRTLRSKKCGVKNEDKIGNEQDGTLEETLPLEQKQKAAHDESKNLDKDSGMNNSNRALMDNNVDDTDSEKDEDYHANKVVRKETEEHNISNIRESQKDSSKEELIDQQQQVNINGDEKDGGYIREDQKDSSEEELPDQQQQQLDIRDESFDLNKVKHEDCLPDNTNHISMDNSPIYGSQLWKRDEKDGNYRITHGIPRSIKFRSITNLYKCTTRLSPVESEYNWNLAKEDSSGKKDVGCKRKWSKKRGRNA